MAKRYFARIRQIAGYSVDPDQRRHPMKKFMLALSLFCLAGSAFAAGKSCEELKAEIAAKLDAKGVSGYSLEIVDKGEAAGGKVVGTCDAGSKVIVYKK
jgi:outer membrane lipoprotein-sorting protein